MILNGLCCSFLCYAPIVSERSTGLHYIIEKKIAPQLLNVLCGLYFCLSCLKILHQSSNSPPANRRAGVLTAFSVTSEGCHGGANTTFLLFSLQSFGAQLNHLSLRKIYRIILTASSTRKQIHKKQSKIVCLTSAFCLNFHLI